jgi:glucose/arabinose dehydrogenase
MKRRRFLLGVAAGAVGLAGCSTDSPGDGTGTGEGSPADTSAGGGRADSSGDETPAEGTDSPGGGPAVVGLETLASGLRGPLDVAFVPDADLRYVAEQRGLIRVHDADGLRSDPLLDLRDAVETGYEKGVLGIALHPEFADNRRLFVRYSASPRSGTPSGYSHTFVLAEFEVSSDGLSVARDSERTVLEIPEPQGNHNAGSIVFGPDGLLYVGVGDGGAANDQGSGHVDDWYDRVGGGNGQDVTANLLGSILRIDVDGRDDGKGYAVPDDNPLVDSEGLDEYYAWGFRNPWRLAFDGEDLYAGDVGQNRYEEIDLVEKGRNYGWNVREGTHCFQADSCPDTTPPDVRGGEELVDPIIEYPHGGAPVRGISVITGNVYRGSAIPSLQGRYVFGDLQARGRLFTATPTEDGLWPTSVLPIAEGDAGKLSQIRSFRRHESELYVLGIGGGSGGLHRIVPAE